MYHYYYIMYHYYYSMYHYYYSMYHYYYLPALVTARTDTKVTANNTSVLIFTAGTLQQINTVD